jgi:hypothetical protein
MTYAECLRHCPAEHIRAWQSDPGFVLAFSTFYGRRFYVSSDNMQVFMSAARANALWTQNRQNIMSCFIETAPSVVKMESWLITHPARTERVFSTLPDLEKPIQRHADGNSGGSSSNSSSRSSARRAGAGTGAAATVGALPTLESNGYTRPLTVVDVHNHRYSSMAHMTMYNSVCGTYRTEVFRLCPVASASSTLSSSGKSVVSVEAAMHSKDKALEFCCRHGFVPQSSFILAEGVGEYGAGSGSFGSEVLANAGPGRSAADDGAAPAAAAAAKAPTMQGASSPLGSGELDTHSSSEVAMQDLWDMYIPNFAEFGEESDPTALIGEF